LQIKTQSLKLFTSIIENLVQLQKLTILFPVIPVYAFINTNTVQAMQMYSKPNIYTSLKAELFVSAIWLERYASLIKLNMRFHGFCEQKIKIVKVI